MPFKSEAQRRYLWANEPEIARDWTDTYGSKIHAANGGIMRLPFQWGGPGSGRDERGYQSSHPSHSSQRNTGPINVHADTAPVIQQQRKTDFLNEVRRQQAEQAPDVFEQSWTGPKTFFGGGYKNLNAPGDTSQGHQSNFGIGNLFRGAMSMFGGIPGSIMSMLSRIDPRQLRGINSLTGKYNTQDEYNKARQQRIDEKRIANILGRKAPITKAMQERLAELGYTGEMPDVGSTGTSRAIDRDDFDINARIQDTSFEQNLPVEDVFRHELEAVPPKNWNFDSTLFDPSQGGIMEIDTETDDDEKNILEKAKEFNERLKQQILLRELTSSSIHPYDKNQPSFVPRGERKLYDDEVIARLRGY